MAQSKQNLKLIKLLISTIALHYIVFISFVITALVGAFYIPWFIEITLVALITRVVFSREECPLTTYENKIRTKLAINLSKGFLKDYIINPKKTILYLIDRLK